MRKWYCSLLVNGVSSVVIGIQMNSVILLLKFRNMNIWKLPVQLRCSVWLGNLGNASGLGSCHLGFAVHFVFTFRRFFVGNGECWILLLYLKTKLYSTHLLDFIRHYKKEVKNEFYCCARRKSSAKTKVRPTTRCLLFAQQLLACKKERRKKVPLTFYIL